MADDLIRASGLWLKDGKNNRKFMSGKVEAEIPAGARLLIFKNDRKQSESEPDYVLNFVAPEDQPPMRRAEPGQGSQTERQPIDDSEIPF